MGLRVQGADELRILGRALKDAGDAGWRRHMFRAAQRATKPVKAEIAESARKTLPKSGGLNEWTARLEIRTRTAVTGRNVGVTIKGRRGGRHDIRKIEEGKVRHPYWGHGMTPPSKIQSVTAGFWSKPLNGPIAARAGREFYNAMESIAAEIARRP